MQQVTSPTCHISLQLMLHFSLSQHNYKTNRFAVFRKQSVLGHKCIISEIEEKGSEQAATETFRTCTIQNECATKFILGNKPRLVTEIHENLHQGNEIIAENSTLNINAIYTHIHCELYYLKICIIPCGTLVLFCHVAKMFSGFATAVGALSHL